MSLPTGTIYGSRVSSSGDKLVNDMNIKNLYLVDEFYIGSTSSTSSSYFVNDSTTTTAHESSRLSYTVSGTKENGGIDIKSLKTDVNDNSIQFMPSTISTAASSSIINSNDIEAKFSSDGISFNSDDYSIFFGSSKTFRIKFFPGGVNTARLVIQYLDELSGTYVTKMSIL